jgi:hypothetical protein
MGGYMLLFHFLILLAALTSIEESDPQLEKLRSTLVSLRTHAEAYAEKHSEALGGVTELTVVKHQLRDWIESRINTLEGDGDEKEFQRTMNDTLKAAELTAKEEPENMLGYLGDIEIMREFDLLIVTTSVGIVCQYDQSAYAYEWADNHWKRIWQYEQNDYSRSKYAPQYLTTHTWQDYENGKKTGSRYILSIGHTSGCMSTWHSVYWGVWRLNPEGSKLLVDGSHGAWLRADTYIIGSIASNGEFAKPKADILLEFTQGSISATVREGIRHYVIDGDDVRRIDPVALSPRDFVDEWLRSSWNESAGWSISPSLRHSYQKMQSDYISGEFSPTMHCRTPDLWQVTLTPQDSKHNFKEEPEVYFLVQWNPPYHFTMMNVSNKPWPLCKKEDPSADEWRTLFAVQEWR